MPRTPVPAYRQTAGFSCGAASLVMALHALRGTPVSRSFEFDLWREATMIGIPGIDQWGLSVPPLKRGVPVTVITESDITFPGASDTVKERFTEEQIELTQFAQIENRQRAKDAGVVWERRAPTLEDVAVALERDQVPILLVDLLALGSDYAAPHWVVGSHREDDRFVLHDPDAEGPGIHRFTADQVVRAMDVSRYLATPTLVVLGP